ncbi:MAG: hypothetical protein EOO29_10520 [Comamonadaceae bacterium]|nr:MAG: hypothetical protein EOO29_10520 [Comamonadaceae bacterium]
MRLNTLELIRYGRFSGQTLDFPRADCDFHLIVGPNEAGKSTLRRAVYELLYGMPLRSDMDFVHPLADLRLGAVIESDAGTLAFHRARGRKSLRRPDDALLADNALAEHLGGTSALMFNRMFGLDLTALIEGGQSILDASDDVGQLLFQSAAGLSTLGTVRDELGKEADSLFAPRKSADRAFYKALTLHDEARQTLRGLTVNVRQWNAVSAQVDAAQAALAQAVQQYAALSAARQQLERVRRIAPRVAQWRDAREQLQALAGTVELPADAAQRLAEAEAAIAAQSATLNARTEALAAWRAQGAELAPQLDDAVLAQAGAIDALAAQGHACAGHAPKIARAEQEVAALLRDAVQAARQLGWPEAEAALRARVPASLALKTLAGLLQERGALQQAQHSAHDAHARAQAVMARLQPPASTPRSAARAAPSVDESATLALFPGEPAAAAPPPVPPLPATPSSIAPAPVSTSPVSPSPVIPSPALAGALQDALAFRGSAARQRTLQLAQAQAQANLQAALTALGTWRMDAAALAGLALPGDDALAALKAERAVLLSGADMARQQHAQAQEKARQSALALKQFAQGRSVVTPDDVRQARAERDALWARIKHEDEPLRAAARLHA